ncbi:PPC domain-containing protein [Flagellimonas eckloniae]|uniref:Secretion system C-terminal sorting domain-containing protein n=1 Tax=Flagellimonas eckloniae TaxID=346185 RepID=A0A0Q0XH12_9FLAO|nr:PPC domain-containing protein [Allomuricauda eckloniae]KQC30369.1 hypothetical protein AAY42_11140 [Allomuricauda eckloniae]
MKIKITCISIALLATIIVNAQITTVNRNIKKEVSNVDATNLYKDIKRNAQSRTTLLKKIANKNKKGHINADWAKSGETDEYRGLIKIPAISFPGYVRVTLTHADKDLGPKMSITAAGSKGGVIITGSPGATENNRTRTAHFSVHPGMTYDVIIEPHNDPESYIPPIPYKLEWEYTGLEDIYEPNDTQKQAKYIDLNKTVTAYAIVGHIKNGVAGNDENLNDWYSVVLDESKKIHINTLSAPNDTNLDIRLYDASGKSLGISRGFNSITSSRSLSKGVYLIQVKCLLKNNGYRKVQYQSKPVPDHFKKPYKFMVSKV